MLDTFAVEGQLVQLGADARLRHQAVGCQLNQSFLLQLDLVELLAQGVVQELRISRVVGQSGIDLAHHAVDVVGFQGQRVVVLLDRPLNLRRWQVGQIAEPFLATAAEKVAVQLAVPAHRLGIDQPALASDSSAAAAEHHAFEVVRQHPVTLATTAAGSEYVLDAVEQIAVDERLMSSSNEFALVDDEPEVVRVLQHAVELAVADRLGVPLGRRAGGQSEFTHGVGQPLE